MRWRAPGSASARPGPKSYGFFYGPGTWYTREGTLRPGATTAGSDIGEGQGVYSFVHIDDAAGATAAARVPPGAYNIVDGNPSPHTCG